MQTTLTMEKSTKSTSHKIEIASFILGVIGLIWPAFIINTCAIAFIYLSDIQDVIQNAKEYRIDLNATPGFYFSLQVFWWGSIKKIL